MVGKAMPGYDPVPRLRPGCLYHLCQSHLDPYKDYVVGVFEKIRTVGSRPIKTGSEMPLQAYAFRTLADNRSFTNTVPSQTKKSYTALISKSTIGDYYIRKITEDDLPLFISSARVTPDFEAMLKKGKIRKRKLSKIRRNNS